MGHEYRLTPVRRAVNALVRLLIRVGAGGRHTYLLTVRGRKSGRTYSTPVTLIEDEQRYLVAPYGEVGWVKNARAEGEVTLTRAGRSDTMRISELEPEDAAPVLRSYVQRISVVRPYFDADPDAPLEAFAAEAPRHPVFRLTGSGRSSTDTSPGTQTN
jgi:deazaflavin-dependent oxidoreductase (nitroreductase family)